MDDPTQRVTYKCIATILRKCGGSLHTLQLGQCCNFEILSLVKQHCCNLRKLEVDVYECDWDAKKLFSSVLRSLQLEYLKITASPRYFSVTLFKAMPSETLTEMHLRVYGLCPTIHPEVLFLLLPLLLIQTCLRMKQITIQRRESLLINFGIILISQL